MKHLDDNDLSRLLDGVVSRSEREAFQRHLAHCDDCLAVYSEALKFRDAGKQNLIVLRKPRSFTMKKLAVAAVLVFAVLVSAIFLIKGSGEGKVSDKIELMADLKKQILEQELQGFSPNWSETDSAILSGILLQNLKLIVKENAPIRYKEEIRKDLLKCLTFLTGENLILSTELAKVGKGNIVVIEMNLRQIMKDKSLFLLFEFGVFLGRAFIETKGGIMPDKSEVEKFLVLARRKDIPQGVLGYLEHLIRTTDAAKYHDLLKKIIGTLFD